MGAARCVLAAEFPGDLRRIEARPHDAKRKLAAAVRGCGTTVTEVFGAGPVVAGIIIGDVRDVSRFPGRDHFAAYNGTAPVEVSSGGRKICRLSRRGNRRINHAIHMAAVTQVRHRHSQGRACYDKKLAEGKTRKEALRALKRQISDAIFTRLRADALRAAQAGNLGGQQGNDSSASAAGSHPAHRLFGQATPGSSYHPTLAPAAPGRARHSPVAATLPPAKPRVQVERPQRSEDERPGGTARRQPHSATRKARRQAPHATPPQLTATSRAAGRTGESP